VVGVGARRLVGSVVYKIVGGRLFVCAVGARFIGVGDDFLFGFWVWEVDRVMVVMNLIVVFGCVFNVVCSCWGGMWSFFGSG